MKISASITLFCLIGVAGHAPLLLAASAELQTDETDPLRQWQIDGVRWVPGSMVTIPNAPHATLSLDDQSSFQTQWLQVVNDADQVPATITALIQGFGSTSAPAALVANGAGDSLIAVVGAGAIAKKEFVGNIGPNLDVSIQSAVHATLPAASFQDGERGPSSVYGFQSRGVGNNNIDDNASNGGNVTVRLFNHANGATPVLTAEGKTLAGQGSLPWQAGAALLNAHSRGGEGNVDQSLVFPGAFGGAVDVTVDQGAGFTLGVAGRADAPAVGVLALSQGGRGGVFGNQAGQNGKGGTVDVAFSGNLSGDQPYSMGVVAASVGAATQSTAVTHPWVSGGGSNVSLTLTGATVKLGSTNTIGLVATSTAENPRGTATASVQGSPNSFRDVSVSIDAASTVMVGNSSDVATATDTTIGVLANSAVSWSAQPFLGTPPGSLGSPGKVGHVTVHQQGKVQALGAGAVGILAQSIAGSGASVSGGAMPFVGEAGAAGGTAGDVTYVGDGGSLAVAGAGAVGLLMQSIAGGGGNGGNAAGLFVAVGGQGGKGGDAGAVSLSLKNGASITTTGDFAQGVVMQSVGGGGGNGGHASAYSLGTPLAAGIGGRGALGGTGGQLQFGGGAGSDGSSRIETSGRHAHGVVAQSIGSGGGKGGAAHSYDGSALVTVALAVGGSGGNGGAGGGVGGANGAFRAGSVADVSTAGHDAHGMLLQSIGGGGGVGGASTAAAFSALSFPDAPTINASFAFGGTGGMGGNGGTILFDMNNNMSTRGASAPGLVVQSIGGGGGAGGDATAGTAAFLATAKFTLNTALAVGGRGGGGGEGGWVDLNLAGTQSTQGHNAAAVLAQSIGGGGGLGGVGNAATVVALPLEESTYQLTVAAGGAGGKGAAGGAVDIQTTGPSVVRTLGAGSSGVVAQSVGGGGGVAGDAGTQGVGGKLTVKVAAGGQGGSGNHGGDVQVGYSGQIITGAHYQAQYVSADGATRSTTPIAVGGGSHGVVAQSVGGGGGMAGNADPSKSLLPDLAETIIDDANKLLDAKGAVLWLASRVVDFQKEEHEFPKSYSVGVGLGGSGGAGGDGGTVGVSLGNNTRILTHGHRSYGVFAQSVGGGGGEAGAASGDAILDAEADLSPLTGADFDFALNVGGQGGAAGHGGNISVLSLASGGVATEANQVTTLGYASHAVLLQSVGGGGGVGHEGSLLGLGTKLAGAQVPGVTLGSLSGGTAVSGDGGNVVFSTANRLSAPTSGFHTLGDEAAAVLAQSIGGGGGLATAGCTNSGGVGTQGAGACHTNAGTASGDVAADATPQAFVNPQLQYRLTIAPTGQGANGGEIVIMPPAGQLTTAGDRSPVIVAQSIGGGGGYLTAHGSNIAATSIGHVNDGSGGDITVGLEQVTLRAEGHGSWGILAQSIGQGGGVAGNLAGDLVAQGTAISHSRKSGPSGGDIDIGLAQGVQVRVGMGQAAGGIVNAHAIVAQSLGSSGGMRSDGGNLLLLGTNGPDKGYGGHISISVMPDALVETRAIGGVGILAHSAGVDANDQKQGIEISVLGGSVLGGVTASNPFTGKALDGIGILTLGGGVVGSDIVNTIQIMSGGSLSTQGGTERGYAIQVRDGQTNVFNSGTITGSVDLGATPGIFSNEPGGVFNAGAQAMVGAGGLHNHGVVNVGRDTDVGVTELQGDFTQYDTGRLVATLDAASPAATHDQLIVHGVARLGGQIQVHANTLLPGHYPIVRASDLQLSAQAKETLLFDWQAEQQGNTLVLRPTARMAQAGLSGAAASLAGYLQRGWQLGDTSKAQVFGYLNQVEGLEHYRNTLQQLGGQQLHAQPQQMVAQAYAAFSDGVQCPVFQTPGVAHTPKGCSWARVSGNRTDQSGRTHTLGYQAEGGGVRLGMQRDLGNDWRLGATVGATRNRLTAEGFSSKGQVFDVSVSLSRQVGAWAFTGALLGAHGSFRNDRTPQLGRAGDALGLSESYSSRSASRLLGVRVRTAYEVPLPTGYIRPYLDLDVIHTRSPSFQESGDGPLGLAVSAVSKTQAVVSPMIEVGTQHTLKSETVVRTYASAGLSVLPNNVRTSQNQLAGALKNIGSFQSRQDGPSAVGRLNLGVQVLKKNGLELNAEYGVQAGGGFRSQSVGARLTLRF